MQYRTPNGPMLPIDDPVQMNRNQFVDKLMNTPAISNNAVTDFIVGTNAVTNGVDVAFTIADTSGLQSVSLLRASVLDVTQAITLQTWTV